MRLKLALAALSLLVSAQFASAVDDAPKVDFDQGVDAAGILQRAREIAAKQLTPIPRVKRKLFKAEKRNKAVKGPGQYQPVSPLITGSAVYPLGVNLRADPKYPALDPAVLKPLETEWTDITAVRSDLLSRASGWEGENEQLYLDGLQLDRDLAGLERRQADLNAEIAQYNQACTTRPLPPDQYQQCVSWRDSLTRRISQLESDITRYNGRVSSWNQRSRAIFDRRGTLVGLIAEWENRIQNWIETVKKAMAAQCRPVDTLESRPPQWNLFTGGFTKEFEVRAFFKSEPKDAPPCPVDYLWSLVIHPPVPDGPIGTISPLTGPKTVFKSGNFPGIGTIVVQDRNSGRGTGSTINVVHPSK
ncbi:MAG: hypothetical protein Q8T11_11800 [Elusimicrobiota bacterium]|nr:hypothetical protein [Elusimicrobiota bacterium]